MLPLAAWLAWLAGCSKLGVRSWDSESLAAAAPAAAAMAAAALLAVAGAAAAPLTKTQYMTLAPKFFGLQRNDHNSTPKASLRTFSTSFSINISRRIFLDRSQGLKCGKK